MVGLRPSLPALFIRAGLPFGPIPGFDSVNVDGRSLHPTYETRHIMPFTDKHGSFRQQTLYSSSETYPTMGGFVFEPRLYIMS
jgi:hypothetical protein